MKKALVVLLAVLFLLPAISFAGNRGHSSHGEGRGGHGSGNLLETALIATGIVVGVEAIRTVINPNRRYYTQPYYPANYDQGQEGYYAPPAYYPPPRSTVCYKDVYGEWRVDRYGNQYWCDYTYLRRVRVSCY